MTDRKPGGRKGFVLVLHALFWAAAMLGGAYFFKDRSWGEDLVLWMIIGFVLTNGLMMTALGRAKSCC